MSPLNSASLKKSASSELRNAVQSGDASLLQQNLFDAWSEQRRKLQQWPVRVASLLEFQRGLPLSAGSDNSQRLQQLLGDHQTVDSADSKRSAASVAAVCEQITVCFSSSLKDDDEPETSGCGAPESGVLELLAAAEYLILHPKAFSADGLWTVYERLATWSPENLAAQFPTDLSEEAQTLRRLICEAEIPFVLSLVLEPFQHARQLHRQAQECLEQGLDACTDTDGSLAAAILRNPSAWLAVFVRIAGWSSVFQKAWGRKATMKRWSLSVEWISSLLLNDGFATRLPKSSEGDLDWPNDPSASELRLLQQAVRTVSLKDGSPVPRFLRRIAKSDLSKPPGKKLKDSDTAMCSQSDWGMVAVMRNCWRPHADLAVLDWDAAEPRLSLATLGTRLIQGTWHSQTSLNGQLVTGLNSWSCTCWFADSEVAFAELLATSASGVTQIRHVMLSLRLHLAILTDTISTSDAECQLTFESQLPLAQHVSVSTDEITRELQLQVRHPERTEAQLTVQAVPAWLEDDRIQHAFGQFTCADDHLQIAAQGRGGLTVPLVLDWHPDRLLHPADWNRLTVTEERNVKSAFDASGFRIRRGPLQLLLYRSLHCGQTLRAVLGYHTLSETMYGRLNNKGRIDPLVVVESAESADSVTS